MSKASYFSAPFNFYSDGNRSSFHGNLRKRKREANREEYFSDSDRPQRLSRSESSLPDQPPTSSAAQYPMPLVEVNLVQTSLDQYRVSGLLYDEDIPGGNFPHTPLTYTSDVIKSSTKLDGKSKLTVLTPPLYSRKRRLVNDNLDERLSSKIGLRRQHLLALTAIMHKCLLQGDYVRAGRAWGLLLRTEVSGRSIDIRAGGRWGIGAEILLQRDGQMAHSPGTQGRNADSGLDIFQEVLVGNFKTGSQKMFSKDGFDRAKSYYDRLILQFQYRKQSPMAIDSLFLYPIMFSLWIYSVQDQNRSVFSDDVWPSDGKCEKDDARSKNGDHEGSEPSKRSRKRTESIRKSLLQGAEDISIRVDELLLSPPYSDDSTLWRLRGMLALWVGDLSVAAFPPSSGSNGGSEDDVSGQSWIGGEAAMVQQERRLRSDLDRDEYENGLALQHRNKEKARAAFLRATALGGTVEEDVDNER
ncbi:hypothetical protein MMC06_005074 [Schaereria dolodes]|nr:hypothetical protein [Schaereria dolodes]